MANNISKKTTKNLESCLDYSFVNLDLLKESLTHPSMNQSDNTKKDYERLEFLGDSILGFLVTEMIFNKYKDSTEGNLAKIKAHLVSSSTLVEIANRLELSQYLIINQGEEKSGGRFNSNNLENAMEALLAAIYLDSNIETTRRVIQNLWKNFVENINLSEADPKTHLQEFLQSKKLDVPKYEIIKKEGAAHSPIFTIKVSSRDKFEISEGKSIKEAEKKAAKKLLESLK